MVTLVAGFPPQKSVAPSETWTIDYLVQQVCIEHVQEYFCGLWNFLKLQKVRIKLTLLD